MQAEGQVRDDVESGDRRPLKARDEIVGGAVPVEAAHGMEAVAVHGGEDLFEQRVLRPVLFQQVADEHGVTHMAAICAICKTQFSKVLPMYGFDMEAIVGIHQMVSNAIVLDRGSDSSPDSEDDDE